MKAPLLLLAATLAGAALAADPARVEVTFEDLARFSDLRSSTMATPREREGLAGILRQHLERAAPERIPAGSRLAVHITDVDMAGEFHPPGAPRDTRIVKDIYPPRIELEFRLVRADGTVEKEGARKLRDSSFLWSASPVSQESMRYEKGLLDDWLQKEFAPAKAASANR
jgi:hypothetical protein